MDKIGIYIGDEKVVTTDIISDSCTIQEYDSSKYIYYMNRHNKLYFKNMFSKIVMDVNDMEGLDGMSYGDEVTINYTID